MKRPIFKTIFVAFLVLSITSCNDDKKKGETVSEEFSNAAGETADKTQASSTGSRYTVKKGNSTIAWEGSKPTGTHTGTISIEDGAVFMENGKVTGGKFLIDMNSIVVTDLEAGDGKENLENHLKGTVEGKEGDFFNVKKYPSSKFYITNVKHNENGMTEITGDLTIKDKTNPVTMMVNIEETDNTITLKSEEFSIDRTKWGVNYGSKSIFDNLGDKFISDDMKIKVTIMAAK